MGRTSCEVYSRRLAILYHSALVVGAGFQQEVRVRDSAMLLHHVPAESTVTPPSNYLFGSARGWNDPPSSIFQVSSGSNSRTRLDPRKRVPVACCAVKAPSGPPMEDFPNNSYPRPSMYPPSGFPFQQQQHQLNPGLVPVPSVQGLQSSSPQTPCTVPSAQLESSSYPQCPPLVPNSQFEFQLHAPVTGGNMSGSSTPSGLLSRSEANSPVQSRRHATGDLLHGSAPSDQSYFSSRSEGDLKSLKEQPLLSSYNPKDDHAHAQVYQGGLHRLSVGATPYSGSIISGAEAPPVGFGAQVYNTSVPGLNGTCFNYSPNFPTSGSHMAPASQGGHLSAASGHLPGGLVSISGQGIPSNSATWGSQAFQN